MLTAAGNALKLLYSQHFHVTCTAHLPHNCAEKVRGHFDKGDNLIARVKAAVVNNKERGHLFYEI